MTSHLYLMSNDQGPFIRIFDKGVCEITWDYVPSRSRIHSHRLEKVEEVVIPTLIRPDMDQIEDAP